MTLNWVRGSLGRGQLHVSQAQPGATDTCCTLNVCCKALWLIAAGTATVPMYLLLARVCCPIRTGAPGITQHPMAVDVLCPAGVLLGAGSFARVYRGRWSGLDVAVKVCR